MIQKSDYPLIIHRAVKMKKVLFKRWPVHIVAQAGKVFRKSGELMFLAEELKYNKLAAEGKAELEDQMREKAYETLAATLRFLEKIEKKEENESEPANDTEQLELLQEGEIIADLENQPVLTEDYAARV